MTERKIEGDEVVGTTSGSELDRDVDPNDPSHEDEGQRQKAAADEYEKQRQREQDN